MGKHRNGEQCLREAFVITNFAHKDSASMFLEIKGNYSVLPLLLAVCRTTQEDAKYQHDRYNNNHRENTRNNKHTNLLYI